MGGEVPESGHLTVIKTLVNPLGVTPPAAFSVVADRTPSGPPNASLAVPAGQSVSIAAPIAANSSCTVTESALPPIANVVACKGGKRLVENNLFATGDDRGEHDRNHHGQEHTHMR